MTPVQFYVTVAVSSIVAGLAVLLAAILNKHNRNARVADLRSEIRTIAFDERRTHLESR
jgi:hypothetical protein